MNKGEIALSNTPQGWYPDPLAESELRWWNGEQWTKSVHPPQATASAPAAPTVPAVTSSPAPALSVAPTPQAVQGPQAGPSAYTDPSSLPPKKRSSGGKIALIVGGIAVGGVIAWVTTLVILLNVFSGPSGSTGPGRHVPEAGSGTVENGYEWMPAVTLDRPDERLVFDRKTSYDQLAEKALTQMNTDPIGKSDGSRVVEVFIDKELTQRVSAFVSSDTGDVNMVVRPHAGTSISSNLDSETSPVTLPIELGDRESKVDWGLYKDYFVVEYFDDDVRRREHPRVTPVTVKGAESLRPVLSPGRVPGSIKVSWDAPSWANASTTYVVFSLTPSSMQSANKAEAGVGAGTVILDGVAQVAGRTEYDSSDDLPGPDGTGLASRINEALLMYTGSSEDALVYRAGDQYNVARESDSLRFAVVAIGKGGTHTAIAPIRPAEEFLIMPQSFAGEQIAHEGLSGIANRSLDPGTYPTSLPMISMDGQTRPQRIELDPSTLKPENGAFTVTLRVKGTALSEWRRLDVSTLEEAQAAVARFNAR